MFSGWLPIGTGAPTVAVPGTIATIELPGVEEDPEPRLAIMYWEYGSYRMWFAPSVITLNIESGNGAEVPPPGAGFDTVIAAHPRLASCAAGTVAVMVVGLV